MNNSHNSRRPLAARRLAGVVAAAAAVSIALVSTANAATHAAPGTRPHPADTSLRALAEPTGLRIGVSINPDRLSDPAYAAIAGGQFSTVTPENQMKWDNIEPTQGTYHWAPAEKVVAFADAHGQKVRGHTLLWANQIPSWLTDDVGNGSITDAQLRTIVKKHVIDEVSHFRGKIWQWDVANEMFANSWDANPLPDGINGDEFWVQHLGEGIIADAFRWAHAADPHALLFYNDYNISGEDGTNAKADAVYAWAKKMRAEGVPIDGIGEQGHLDTQYGFSGDLERSDLQRYAGLGLKVAITEADVRTFVDSAATQVPTDSLAASAQSNEFSQELQACLEVRSCISFTVWDVDDADSWVPGTFAGEGAATLYDVNLKPKAQYTALQQTLQLAAGAPRR
ncbi:MAG: endo-1,4-beta-xylanase [Nocardioidaceae bacterium]|nr:endo-1,4-beta-xylanase [Nocardioidaceae bacterium]MCL2614058.1 endo-1,4-beta-xylanase [Nocardioidaceae bacterium]